LASSLSRLFIQSLAAGSRSNVTAPKGCLFGGTSVLNRHDETVVTSYNPCNWPWEGPACTAFRLLAPTSI